MSELRLCRECKFSTLTSDGFSLKCFNAEVNASDPWALSSKIEYAGTDCRTERERGVFSGVCGKRGAMWEGK